MSNETWTVISGNIIPPATAYPFQAVFGTEHNTNGTHKYLPVNPKAFGAKGDGVTDDTAAFIAAQNSQPWGYGIIPAGTYVLNNLSPMTGIRVFHWKGSGRDVTFIKQANIANPAYNFTSTSAGAQGGGLEDVTFIGLNGGVVVAKIHADGINVVTDYVFRRIQCNCNGGGGIEVSNDLDVGNVYGNIVEDITIFEASGICFQMGGANNVYRKIQVLYSAGPVAVHELGPGNNIIEMVMSDGVQIYAGQGDTIINPTVETIYTPSPSQDYAAITVNGYHNTVINPQIANVAVTTHHYKGIAVFNDGNVIINPTISGTVYPSYPISLDSNYGTIMGFNVPSGYTGFKLEQYTSSAVLDAHNLIGVEQISSIIRTNIGGNLRLAGGVKLITGTAAPTTGNWLQGDRCINATPSVGQPKGWVCTVAGTPGTWVSEGNL